jgi:hypothetical protein
MHIVRHNKQTLSFNIPQIPWNKKLPPTPTPMRAGGGEILRPMNFNRVYSF